MKYADLHVHTHYSDGTFSPPCLIDQAVSAGLSCVSITDHDTVEAIDIAISAAMDRIEIIPGIELSTEHEGHEIHILGYCMDYQDRDFLAMLRSMREIRTNRIFGICEKLAQLKIYLDPDDIFRLSEHGSVGRLHVARALKLKGYVSDIREAFARYIGDKGPAYIGKFKMTPKEAIAWILRVNGIPVLAHPCTLAEKSLIEILVRDGLRGLEVFYPEHSSSQVEAFRGAADRFGLLMTGGSDCHGEAKDELKIGKIKLSYEYVERLKAEANKLKEEGRRKREERRGS